MTFLRIAQNQLGYADLVREKSDELGTKPADGICFFFIELRKHIFWYLKAAFAIGQNARKYLVFYIYKNCYWT